MLLGITRRRANQLAKRYQQYAPGKNGVGGALSLPFPVLLMVDSLLNRLNDLY